MTRWMLGAILALLLLTPLTSHAFTCTATGCTFTAKYTEPTTVITGAPLSNLTSCTVHYAIAVDGGTLGANKLVTVLASSPNGGGQITKAITDTALTPGHNYLIAGAAFCTNPSGNSADSAPFTALAIPRAGEVPPNPTAVGSFE